MTVRFVPRTENETLRTLATLLLGTLLLAGCETQNFPWVWGSIEDVNSWEFNDAGFGGMGRDRDDMELSVSVTDRRKKRVKDRANISVRSDFRIIKKYVDEF